MTCSNNQYFLKIFGIQWQTLEKKKSKILSDLNHMTDRGKMSFSNFNLAKRCVTFPKIDPLAISIQLVGNTITIDCSLGSDFILFLFKKNKHNHQNTGCVKLLTLTSRGIDHFCQKDNILHLEKCVYLVARLF